MSEQKYYTTKEAAAKIGIHVNTMLNWNKMGIFKPEIIDHKGKFFYPVETIDQMAKTYKQNESMYHSGTDCHNGDTIGSTLVGQIGSTLVGQIGSTLVGQIGSTLVGQIGSTLVGQIGSTLVGQIGSTLVGQIGSTLVGQIGSTLVGKIGSTLVGQIGSTLVGNYQKPKRDGFMTSLDVASTLGVTETSVRRWRKEGKFLEDIKDHKGIYWYSIERVEQLKSVYRTNDKDPADNISAAQMKHHSDNDKNLIQDSTKKDYSDARSDNQIINAPDSKPTQVSKSADVPVLETENLNDDEIITLIIANLQRDKKGEKILASTYNFKLILNNDPLIKDCIAYDLFNQQPTRLKIFSWTKTNLKNDTWRDVDDAGIQDYIALTYGIRNQAVFNTTFLVFTHQNSFHPVRDYFNNLPEWDGFSRAETVFIDGLFIPDTRYSRIITRHWLLAAVSRIFNPGCKWDCVLTIKSPQGSGKSTIFNRLGVNWFTDSIGSLDGKDALEQLQGNWIIELAELQATKQSENEQIKAFLSRKVDKFRKSYGHNVESYPRQCVFCGSTNSEEFLKDHTGGRRFLLLISTATADTFDKRMKGLTKEYVNKIWAEVFHWYKELFGDNGENFDENMLDIPQDVKMEAVELQNRYTEGSALEATVTSFLEKKIPREKFWKVMNKRERRAWMNGELKSIDSDRVGEDGSYTALKEEEERYKVCAAEIAYEAMGIDNPGEPKNRLLIRQINEILSRLPDWQRAQAKFGVRFGDYGRQKISFIETRRNTPSFNYGDIRRNS